jgi:hypothetical protein
MENQVGWYKESINKFYCNKCFRGEGIEQLGFNSVKEEDIKDNIYTCDKCGKEMKKEKLPFMYEKIQQSSKFRLSIAGLFAIYAIYDVFNILNKGVKGGLNILSLFSDIIFIFILLAPNLFPNSRIAKKTFLLASIWIIFSILTIAIMGLLNYKKLTP